MQIVKVRYYSETTGDLSDRSYTYFSEEELEVGDILTVPVKDTTGKAKVSEVNVPEFQILAFKDKVKVIPAGSLIRGANLCKTCKATECGMRSAGFPIRDCPAYRTEPGPGFNKDLSHPEGITAVGLSGELPAGKPGDESWKEIKPLGPLTDTRTEAEKVADAGPYGVQEFPAEDPPPREGEVRAEDGRPIVSLAALSPGMAVVKVKPQDDPKVRALAQEATKLRDYAVARTISTDADCKPATEDLSVIARVKKALTEAKADYTKPIRGYLEDVNAAFTLILAPLDEADKVTRNKILSYRDEQAKRAAEAEAINQQKAELARREAQFNGTGEITIDTTPVQAQEPVKRVSTDLGTASVQKVTTWELVDFAAVPDQYKVLDSGKITKLVKGGGTIPGIKVIVKEGLRVTTR